MKGLLNKRTLIGLILSLVVSLIANVLGILLPRVASESINQLFIGELNLNDFRDIYLGYVFIILIVTILQTFILNIVVEELAANLRARVINKISELSYNAVKKLTTAKLLTNLTSDIDAVKNLFGQGIIQMFTSIILILGASISMLTINVNLALIVIATIPLLFISFGVIFSSINKFFKLSQENLDKLNKVINESIVGASLIKVLNGAKYEMSKFHVINELTKATNLKIVYGFASLIPFISILSNIAILAIVYFGGSQVIDFINSIGVSGLTPGDYAAFFTYVGIFIGPIFILGFVSSTIARSFTSIKRINETLNSTLDPERGKIEKALRGEVEFREVSLDIDNRSILRNISFKIKAGTKNAIVGPTAGGKTQIFNLIAGLQTPTSGEIFIDNVSILDIDRNNLYSQIALVFQDSIIFNTTIKENILFNANSDDSILNKAIDTAELKDFIAAQDKGIETVITERGASLSGGQKQRITLARALAIQPKLLLLDDFTARVDIQTEKKIINNLKKNFPKITLLSITQKIESIKDYDQIFLIMEGELIAQGTHEELLEGSFEYKQIFNSQQTTE